LGESSGTWSYTALYQFLLEEAQPTSAVQTNCWSSAYRALKGYNDSTAPLYYESLDYSTWIENYDAGEYRTSALHFSFNATDNSSQTTPWQLVAFNASTFVRVDVKPREWYTPSLPFLLSGARTGSNGLCRGERIGHCFFDEVTGLWTGMISGLMIVSDCTINTQFPHGSGNTTCMPGIPYIAAHIIQRMPVRDAFCPCAPPKPYITPFCTAPWSVKERD